MAVAPFQVLFVCTGNICRSPTAEGVFRHMVQESDLAARIGWDSAGTFDYHVGDPPDPRTLQHAERRGYDFGDLRARLVVPEDFDRFDLVLAMASDHHRDLARLQRRSAGGQDSRGELAMFLGFVPGIGTGGGRDVPDPYYGGDAGFEHVLDLVENGCRGLLAEIRDRLG